MKVIVIGGRGFLGEAITEGLDGEIYTLDRHKGGKHHYQRDIVQDDLSCLQGFDIIINLVGLSPVTQPRQGYYPVHVEGVNNILENIDDQRLIHISALGADSSSEIGYIRTKGIAEQRIRTNHDNHLIVRPSIIYDAGNELISILEKTAWLRFFPKIPMKTQPIHRDDVAEIIIEETGKKGTINVAGPKTYTFWEMAEIVKKSKGYKQINIPYPLFKPFMHLLRIIPWSGVTKDQLMSLELDNTTTTYFAEGRNLTNFEEWINR
mgnify:CR=1 FL=1